MSISALGYAGAILLAICALPQAVMSYLHGNSHGLSHIFLWSWFLGEIFMLAFIVKTIGPQGPLFYNYALNTFLLYIIVYYKYFPRN